ncbi:MAG: hypothetical protein NC253_11820 [Ruminococcus sp.]|nr:hypothetical protein [Ruminococcus sp.]MCM1479909.1 hypothetical protein [Muribaculaceae bacterium]
MAEKHLPLTVECGYCGSVYDYSEQRSCPNCGAVPDKAQINAAKEEVRAAAKAEAEAKIAEERRKLAAELKLAEAKNAVPQTGKFMRKLIKLIPLWVAVIFVVIWIPGFAESSAQRAIMENMQVIDTPEYKSHELGESFFYDRVFTVTADEFFIADSEAVRALLPENFKLLVVHMNALSDGSGGTNDYYDIDPYITDGKVCRAPVSPNALRSLPDAFAQTAFYFYGSSYVNEKDGYLCFIVDGDMTSVDLCIEETHLEGYIRQLDYVHKITLDLTEVTGE